VRLLVSEQSAVSRTAMHRETDAMMVLDSKAVQRLGKTGAMGQQAM
jgi:hypothetical protein